jgi:cytochrome bd-type quinol oxidase subunit 2
MRTVAAGVVLALLGAAGVVAVVEGAGGDLAGWPLWQAVAVPAALVVVPALLSAWVARRHGAAEAVLWAVVCAGLQVALVFGVGFLALGYGPS